VTGVLPAASLYAITRSFLANCATASSMCTAPLNVTLAFPVNEEPGNSPTSPPASPLIVVGPVLVIAEPAKTPNVEVVPRFTVDWAAKALIGGAAIMASTSVTSIGLNRILLSVFINIFTPHYSNLSLILVKKKCTKTL